jgi:hypothetical protein
MNVVEPFRCPIEPWKYRWLHLFTSKKLMIETKLKRFCIFCSALLFFFSILNVQQYLAGLAKFEVLYTLFRVFSILVSICGSVSFILSTKLGIFIMTAWSLVGTVVYILLLFRPNHLFDVRDLFLVVALILNTIMFFSAILYIIYTLGLKNLSKNRILWTNFKTSNLYHCISKRIRKYPRSTMILLSK